MEIKATLNKPYTEKERLDFIVAQNHKQGYTIKETDTALEAWGYTREEQEELAKAKKIQILNTKIADLEKLSLSDLLAGNEVNINVYKDIIQGLIETRDNL